MQELGAHQKLKMTEENQNAETHEKGKEEKEEVETKVEESE